MIVYCFVAGVAEYRLVRDTHNKTTTFMCVKDRAATIVTAEIVKQ